MSDGTAAISVKGKQKEVDCINFKDIVLVSTGGFFKIVQVHDDVWMEYRNLPDPVEIIKLLKSQQNRPDLFTFSQRVPDVTPRYTYYFDWENVAAASTDTYQSWFETIVDRSVRKHIRKSQREGVITKIIQFDDTLVEGICSIYNELEVRQGRKFWHYGKSFKEVKRDNGTYLDRSVFVGAYFKEELIGFLKFVIDSEVGTIMQILSKSSYSQKRPTNALLAKAVEACESRQIKYLIYGKHTYGKKKESTLIEFKENNGFKKIDFPRYYVPLTSKGKLGLKLGVHNGWENLVPESIARTLLNLRSKYQDLRMNISKWKKD
jgi:hypothetical protein